MQFYVSDEKKNKGKERGSLKWIHLTEMEIIVKIHIECIMNALTHFENGQTIWFDYIAYINLAP